ncbi:unnamed protein product, partial [Symbiodinium necroappetens]
MMNMQQMMAKAGGAAPQQGMNPMAAMMGVGGNGAGSGPRLPADKEKPTLPQDDDETIDPDIRELGDYFNIEERWVVRLNEAMKKRQDSKAVDIEKLYEVLEKARSPTGLLTVQIGKMECGQFVGKIKPDKDVERMARKFKLDDPVTSRLTELKVWRKRNGEEDRATKDLERIEHHLRFAKRPNALCTLLVGKLIECEMDELPDLVKAEKIMTDYKLDEDACSKMREIMEKRRYEDEDRVIASVRKHLNSASNASSMSLGFASFWHLVGMSVGISWYHIELWLHQLPFLYDCRLSVKAVLNLLIELISDQCVCWICAICAFNLATSPSLLEPFDPGCAKLPGSSSMDKTCRIRLSDHRKAKEEERTVARKMASVQSADVMALIGITTETATETAAAAETAGSAATAAAADVKHRPPAEQKPALAKASEKAREAPLLRGLPLAVLGPVEAVRAVQVVAGVPVRVAAAVLVALVAVEAAVPAVRVVLAAVAVRARVDQLAHQAVERVRAAQHVRAPVLALADAQLAAPAAVRVDVEPVLGAVRAALECMANMGGGGPVPQAAEKDKPVIKEDDDETIDPDLRELGDYFNIEERWVVRLNEAMKKRQDTKAQDIEKLYEVQRFRACLHVVAKEKARSPTGLLTVQIGKMECGQFVGKIKPDKDVERMARKFKLDDHVTSRVTELKAWISGKVVLESFRKHVLFGHESPATLQLSSRLLILTWKVWRKRTGEEDRAAKDFHLAAVISSCCLRLSAFSVNFLQDLERIEYHLRFAKRPNALCTLLVAWHNVGTVGRLLEGEIDELPDLTNAEKIMTDFKLDEDYDACSKLREIIEKRSADEERVLTSVRKHLKSASNASSMLCKIARQLIDGQDLPDPPERPPKGKGGGKAETVMAVIGITTGTVTVQQAPVSHTGHKRDRSRSRDRRERRDSRGRITLRWFQVEEVELTPLRGLPLAVLGPVEAVRAVQVVAGVPVRVAAAVLVALVAAEAAVPAVRVVLAAVAVRARVDQLAHQAVERVRAAQHVRAPVLALAGAQLAALAAVRVDVEPVLGAVRAALE